MMDEFEKNIRDNKGAFERQRPNREKMWANIEGRLPAQEAKRIPLWKNTKLRFAAGFALLFGLASILFFSVDNSSSNAIAAAPNELLEINMHYKKMVSYQIKKLESNTDLSPEEKSDFINYITELEEENESLKLELNSNLDNQEVLEAIIANYKKQIDIIEKLLYRLNHTQKENKDEGITI